MALERLVAEVESFLERSWRAADLLAESEAGDALFAVQRAYYAVYHVAMATAILLDIELAPYQGESKHHVDEVALVHSKVPVLVAHLVNLMHPPDRIGARQQSPEATEAFATARALQKVRLRADYMGTETVTREQAQEYIQKAKKLTASLWGYCCDNR